MEQIITILIYIHAFFGGLGLITGIASVLVKKGKRTHKRMGNIFSYAMIISCLTSLLVARLPNHENLFLFLIGVFTIYLVLSGNRALKFKTKKKVEVVDKVISGTMLIFSIFMISLGFIGLLQKVSSSILYLFFGGFGVFMSLKDFKIYKTFLNNKNTWLKSHIGRMIGALIASVTAFMVAGLKINTLMVWMLPSIIGTGYIIYWKRKLKNVID